MQEALSMEHNCTGRIKCEPFKIINDSNTIKFVHFFEHNISNSINKVSEF